MENCLTTSHSQFAFLQFCKGTAFRGFVIKKFYILAGANGSGKSTISKVLLPAEGLVYVNADDIAKELNPENPLAARIEAGRKALHRIASFIENGESFAIESTLSGLQHLKTIQKAQRRGYVVTVIYVYVESPEVCIARIAARVRGGGHFVPDEDVRRRYWRSKRNFVSRYAPSADTWALFHNGESQIVYVARGQRGKQDTVFSRVLYDKFKEDL